MFKNERDEEKAEIEKMQKAAERKIEARRQRLLKRRMGFWKYVINASISKALRHVRADASQSLRRSTSHATVAETAARLDAPGITAARGSTRCTCRR